MMSVRSLAALLVLSTFGCSSDPSGPNPPPPPPPPPPAAYWLLNLTTSNIVVREMCDEFPLDADGAEWSYQLTLRFPDEASQVIAHTNNYPSAAAKRSVGRGGILPLDANAVGQSRTSQSQPGDKVVLSLSATEWDYDVLGNNPFPDSRMNNRTTSVNLEFVDGAWKEAPAGKLTLTGTNACVVDVNYRFEAVKQ